MSEPKFFKLNGKLGDINLANVRMISSFTHIVNEFKQTLAKEMFWAINRENLMSLSDDKWNEYLTSIEQVYNSGKLLRNILCDFYNKYCGIIVTLNGEEFFITLYDTSNISDNMLTDVTIDFLIKIAKEVNESEIEEYVKIHSPNDIVEKYGLPSKQHMFWVAYNN